MPRNLSGVYTLPAGNPVVPGTTIDANWANSTLSDMANEITNSLSRTGAGGMLAPFRIDDGNVTGPGLSFLNETNTGYYRLAAGSTAFSVLGVNTLQMNTTSVTVPSNRTLNAQGNSLVGGTFGVTGAAAFASTLVATGAITALGGVLGNITAASGTSSFNDVTISGSLDMVAGSLATITGLSNPTNASDAANKGYVDTQDALKLNLTGGTMSGNLAMGNNLITGLGTAVSGGDATNKTYVDGQIATRLALAGGTMSGAIAMGTNKITGLGTPTADADAATKAYVDSVAQGLDVKGSVRAATTGNITLSGTQTIDGVAIGAGDRVLVKDQSTAANNGIYVAAAGAWSRAADADTWAELVGAFVFVEDGTTNDNSGWVCTSPPGGTLGVTAVTFEQFSGAGQINAGTGMTKTGNTLNVNTASSSRIVVGADEIDLAQTGVTAGTYKSVTVDLYGRVTAGTNPTTLAGYGITDAYTQTQTDTLLNGKLSLTGGTMSGALAMGTSKITGLGNPTNAQDAATKTYVDTADALKLNLTGGTMSGALAMGTNRITGLGDPVNAQDAATKNYIDTIFGSTTSAAASAAAAASSASSASSSASSASSSASSASSSASTASTALFNFRAQYLGPLASDPSVDGNGNPVSTGDLYFNTTASETRVYNGSAWVAAYVPTAGYALLAAANVFTNNQTITVNTSNDALKITQTGSGNALYIEDVAADATPFVVSSTGAVGIGTTTPDNVTSAGIALVSNDGFYPQVVNRNKTNDTTASYLVFDKDRAGAIVQNGDGLGNIVWRSFDGANYLQSAAIIAYSDGAPGTNDVPGRLSFFTTSDGASSPTERFRIASTGAWGLSGANYGTSGQALVSSGALAAPTWGTLSVAGGGTGATSLTANSVLLGNGTSALQVVAPGTSGNVLTSNGTTWTSAAPPSSAVQYPQNIQSADYTLVLGDAGKQIFHPASDIASRTYTIPANSSVAFPIGTVVLFTVENGGAPVRVAINSDTLVIGDGRLGAATVQQNNTLMAIKVTSTKWMANYLYQSTTRTLFNLAIGNNSNPHIDVYAWSSSGYGTRYSSPSSPVGSRVNGVAFAPNGSAIAMAIDSSTYVRAYPWSAVTGFGAVFSNPATLPTLTGNGIAFSPAGDAVAVAHGIAPSCTVYPWSTSGFGTKYANPSTAIGQNGFGVAFHPSGNVIAIASNNSPQINAYAWSSSGFGTKYANPSTMPSGAAYGIAFSPSGNDIAIVTDTSPRIFVYPWSSSTGYGTKYADPGTLPTGTSYGVAFSPNGDAIAVAHDASPFVTAYPWSSSGFGTKYTNPATAVGGQSQAVAFAPLGDAITVASIGVPYLQTYQFNSTAGFGARYTAPTTLPAGGAYSVTYGLM